jgi:hypothetical protein
MYGHTEGSYTYNKIIRHATYPVNMLAFRFRALNEPS